MTENLNEPFEELKSLIREEINLQNSFYHLVLTRLHCAHCNNRYNDGTGSCITQFPDCDLQEFHQDINKRKKEYFEKVRSIQVSAKI